MSTEYSARINTTAHAIELLASLFEQTSQRVNKNLSWIAKAQITILSILEHKTVRALAKDFQTAKTTVQETITRGQVLLADLFETASMSLSGEHIATMLTLYPSITEQGYVLVDCTCIHTQNAYKEGYFCNKHSVCGLKVLTVTTPEGQVIWVSRAYPGAVHDKRILDLENVQGLFNSIGIGLVGDKGFQGLNPEYNLTPIKKPKWRKLTRWEKEQNKWINRIRCFVEHSYASLKLYKIAQKCRRRLYNAPTSIQACVNLLILEGRWN